jgi:hypothetical protein
MAPYMYTKITEKGSQTETLSLFSAVQIYCTQDTLPTHFVPADEQRAVSVFCYLKVLKWLTLIYIFNPTLTSGYSTWTKGKICWALTDTHTHKMASMKYISGVPPTFPGHIHHVYSYIIQKNAVFTSYIFCEHTQWK